MKRHTLLLIMGLVAISAGSFFVMHSSRENKKQAIVDEIMLYKDSMKIGEMELRFVNQKNTSVNLRDYIQADARLSSERLRIKSRLWKYQWKIDSLNMRLKQY